VIAAYVSGLKLDGSGTLRTIPAEQIVYVAAPWLSGYRVHQSVVAIVEMDGYGNLFSEYVRPAAPGVRVIPFSTLDVV
jgi:hypothetical protein